MTQEQYKHASLMFHKLENFRNALEAMNAADDVALNINWYRRGNMCSGTTIIKDDGLNYVIKEYLAKLISELEKEFEEL